MEKLMVSQGSKASRPGFQEKPLNILKESIDISLIGCFTQLYWEDVVNQQLDSTIESYWLPWGNRTKSIRLILNRLVERGLWEVDPFKTFQHYKPLSEDYHLKFFHYRSKQQGRMAPASQSACIQTRYDIAGVFLSRNPVIPLGKIHHDLLAQESESWFLLKNKYLLPSSRHSQALDFSDFDILDTQSGQFSFFDHKNRRHTLKLYQDLAIVRHMSHKASSSCQCYQCRS